MYAHDFQKVVKTPHFSSITADTLVLPVKRHRCNFAFGDEIFGRSQTGSVQDWVRRDMSRSIHMRQRKHHTAPIEQRPIAERLHPSLRENYVALPPAGEPLTDAQLTSVFGGDLRAIGDVLRLGIVKRTDENIDLGA